ncbi:hypothetical protein J3F84DRAFT_217309 [Trichoderma pleuroticola]
MSTVSFLVLASSRIALPWTAAARASLYLLGTPTASLGCGHGWPAAQTGCATSICDTQPRQTVVGNPTPLRLLFVDGISTVVVVVVVVCCLIRACNGGHFNSLCCLYSDGTVHAHDGTADEMHKQGGVTHDGCGSGREPAMNGRAEWARQRI